MGLFPLEPPALRLAWSLDPEGLLRSLDRAPAFGAFVLPLYEEMPAAARLRFLNLLPDLLAAAEPHRSGPFAYAAADCAVRGLLPAALSYAGLLEREAFGYLRTLSPVADRDSAHRACLAAWDATVALTRLCDEAAPAITAREARDAATDMRFGVQAWVDGAYHAAQAARHCARVDPHGAWAAVFTWLDRLASLHSGSSRTQA